MSPTPFLYFLFRKGQQAGPSSASQRYEDAMRFGSPAEKLREASRKTVRELFAFWILGTVTLGLCIPAATDIFNGQANISLIKSALILWACGVFIPAWLLYRLIRFAIGR